MLSQKEELNVVPKSKLRRKRLSEQLTAQLRKHIIQKGLKPGDPLSTEQEWCEKPTAEAKQTKTPSIIQDAFPGYHGVAWYWRDFTPPTNPHADPVAERLLRNMLRHAARDSAKPLAELPADFDQQLKAMGYEHHSQQ